MILYHFAPNQGGGILDRPCLTESVATAKRWWFFTILSVIALTCGSCGATAQQIPASGRGTAQSLSITQSGRMPLTNSEPAQGNMTTVSVSGSPPPKVLSTATPAMILLAAPTSYEAEASQNTLIGPARVIGCGIGACSGGKRVGYIGLNSGAVGTLQFNNIKKNISGQYTLKIYYIIAGLDRLTLYISVNSQPEVALNVARTANGERVGTASIAVNLKADNNTVEFSNPSVPAPDIDRIVI